MTRNVSLKEKSSGTLHQRFKWDTKRIHPGIGKEELPPRHFILMDHYCASITEISTRHLQVTIVIG